MRVLVFAPAFEPAVRAGGPARSITNLVRNASQKHDVVVVAPDRDVGDSQPFPGLSGKTLTRGNAKAYYINESSPHHWVSLVRQLSSQPFDLILLNSIWHRKMAALPALLRGMGVLKGPLALMPRGELEPGALALESGKKSIGGPAFRALYRRTVSVFGSTSPSEAQNLAVWFPNATVLMTSNLPEEIPLGFPEDSSGSLRVLVLGRVHPTKGLLPLLRGLSGASGRIRVTAQGPIEAEAYWSDCRSAAADLPSNVEFEYGGMAGRSEIPPLLWNSDCMVLLTAGENYGHVIAEALQAGCPVITTPTTPWTDVIRGGGGDIVENRDDADDVAEVLDRWAAMTSDELAASRLRARAAFEEFQAAAGPNIIDLALEVLAPRS